MATMTITITVSCNGVTWSRTASVEVDTASMQDGLGANALLFGTEAVTSANNGMHSYGGLAVGVFANKAKGSIGLLQLNNGSLLQMFVGVTTYLPVIVYSGAGTGFNGAFNTSATATDVADEDIAYVVQTVFTGSQKTTALVGLKAIS